jgi:hypothetical protein
MVLFQKATLCHLILCLFFELTNEQHQLSKRYFYKHILKQSKKPNRKDCHIWDLILVLLGEVR